jgi:hypothetical protein
LLEKWQSFGQKAKQATSSLLGKDVRIGTHGRDKHRERLGTVFQSEVNINQTLVKEGWCWWFSKYVPKDAALKQLEQEAREANTPGAFLSSAASTQESAVSASSGSVLSTHSPALPSPEDIDDSRLASPVRLSPDLETSAIAATQLNYQPVQTKPWASQFVGSGSMEEEDELMVVL